MSRQQRRSRLREGCTSGTAVRAIHWRGSVSGLPGGGDTLAAPVHVRATAAGMSRRLEAYPKGLLRGRGGLAGWRHATGTWTGCDWGRRGECLGWRWAGGGDLEEQRGCPRRGGLGGG